MDKQFFQTDRLFILETERLIFRKTDRKMKRQKQFLDRETDGQVLFSDRQTETERQTLFLGETDRYFLWLDRQTKKQLIQHRSDELNTSSSYSFYAQINMK